jgi:hypothetical protein
MFLSENIHDNESRECNTLTWRRTTPFHVEGQIHSAEFVNLMACSVVPPLGYRVPLMSLSNREKSRSASSKWYVSRQVILVYKISFYTKVVTSTDSGGEDKFK